MAVAKTEEAVRLAGPPHNLSGTIASEGVGSSVATVTLRLGDSAGIVRARVRGIGAGRSEVRMRLPRSTPPGTYVGEGKFPGGARKVVVEVEARTRLRMQPRETFLTAPPGASVDLRITLVNHGNLPLEVPEKAAVDLDDLRGPDRALGRALRADLGEGETRVGRLFEELRDDHGGEAQVTVVAGVGLIGPGQSREVRARLDLPDTLDAGRSYAGAWSLGGGDHGIAVQVTEVKPNGARRKKK